MTDRGNLKTGERRVATILFSDMKGFTSLSEHMDPEEMDALMTRVFGMFEQIIRAHGGAVEKYIGDALVAVFGVPELHEDDPSRAAHAALEFLSRVKEENARLGGRGLAFRTGIHTGLVTTGKRGEYDVVTGHAMSVAERLEAAAAPGSVLVSEATREKCELDYEFSEPRDIEAKGKTEPIRAYELKGESFAAMRDLGPFVGRQDILDEMLKTYIRDRLDEVSGFFLSGEAGIGKTRLIQAFVDKLRLFPDFKTPILAARAQKYRPGGFAVIVDMVLGYFGLAPKAGRAEAARALSVFPDVAASARERFIDLVCCGDAEHPDTSSITALYDVFEAILERHSGDLFPIVAVVDNANSMDRLSREFFQYLFKNGTIKPFFLLAGREFPPELRKAFLGLKVVKVPPLTPTEAEAMVRGRWPDAEPAGMRRILEACMGNPLFLREYAAYARKHRDLSALPSTVQNIFLTSLERYKPEWRDLAKRLSAFLQSFTLEDARYIQAASGFEEDVEPALERFVKDGLLVKEESSYSFRADVYKRALYASLLNHNKRILHGLIADILLKRDRPHRIRLIHHLVRAERYAEAAQVMLDDPTPTYNYEFLPYIDVLLRRLRNEEKLAFRLLVTKSAILFNSGKIDESEAVLQRIVRTAIVRKDANLMGFAYHQICVYNVMTYSFQKAVFTGQKALYYYRRSEVRARSVQNVLRMIAEAHVIRNEPDEARRLVNQCESLPGGDPATAAEARAEFHLLTGDYDKALDTIVRSLAGIREERTPERFFAYDIMVKTQWQLCDFAGLRDSARRLLGVGALSESSLSQANAMLAIASLLYGERDVARDSFVQAEFYAGQIRNVFDRVDALRTLALCRHMAGEGKKAESTALEALTLGLRHSCYWPTFTLLVLLAETSYMRGKEERARFFLVEASYFFTTGLLLPTKDLILYYWLASKLMDQAPERNLAVADRLMEEEKAKIGREELVANFLSIRSFGKIQREMEGRTVLPGEQR